MSVTVRAYEARDIGAMIRIWNEVVEDGVAFPQQDCLDAETGAPFFAANTHCAVAVDDRTGAVLGLYILHPNNVGRCGHICNASYAVARGNRGLHIGERLVQDSLAQGKRLGFALMQFNAVVAANGHARHLYERLGFRLVGLIPQGFLMKDGHYEDICVYYRVL